MSASVIKRFIFTALPCEAKPFITQLKLNKDNGLHPFALYANADTALIVSGCGKVAMAAAVAYGLAYFTASAQPILVNVGIAGHQSMRLGSLFAAHKITDVDTGKNHYPQLVSQLPCMTLRINTVSKPDRVYADNGLYEMEASGFYEIASRFSSAELIQTFKVVSDNQHSPLERIDENWVFNLMTAQVLPILEGINSMEHSTAQLLGVDSTYYEQAISQWHFTVTAQHQLKALLQRWSVLSDNAALDFAGVEFNHSKGVLTWLEKKIAALPFML